MSPHIGQNPPQYPQVYGLSWPCGASHATLNHGSPPGKQLFLLSPDQLAVGYPCISQQLQLSSRRYSEETPLTGKNAS